MKLRQKIYLIISGLFILILVAAFLLVKNAGLIVKHKLEDALGKGFSVEKVDVGWRELKAINAVLKKPDDTVFFKAGKVSIFLNMEGIIRKEFKFSRVTLTEPYLLIEIDKAGRYINPLKASTEQKKEKTSMPEISVGSFIINKGSIDYSDGKVSRLPHLTRIRDIEFQIDDFSMPFIDRMSNFSMVASVPGTYSSGEIRGRGQINLKTQDMKGKINISNLDITTFKPYFEKKGEAKIMRGFIDIDMNITIKNWKIKAPGRAVLRGLEFASTTTKDRFLGVPRSAVIGLLKDSNGTITIDFVIEGDINNPKFNLRESLLEKMTLGLADKLGLSVTRIGESIIVEGAKQVEKGLGGIGKGIERLFK